MAQPQIETARGVTTATQMQTQVIDVQRIEGLVTIDIKRKLDNGGLTAVPRLDTGMYQRVERHLVAGTKTTGGSFDGPRCQRRADLYCLASTQDTRLGRELHDCHAGNRPQVVGPQHRNQRMSQLGKFILDLFTHTTGEKGKALQQALNIRVGTTLGKKTAKAGVGLGEFPPLLLQAIKFVPIVAIEHAPHSLSCLVSVAETLSQSRHW